MLRWQRGLDEFAGPVIRSDPDLRILLVKAGLSTRPPNRACSGALSVGVDLLSGPGFAHRFIAVPILRVRSRRRAIPLSVARSGPL